LAHQKKNCFGDGYELDVDDRDGYRTPWLAVDQCHFAKDIVTRKFGHRSVADLNAHIAVLDNESPSACSPLRKMTPPAFTLRVSTSFPVKRPKSASAAISNLMPTAREGTCSRGYIAVVLAKKPPGCFVAAFAGPLEYLGKHEA
jgi:hypothetical protein